MSSFEAKADRKGPEAFLDTRERANLTRMLSFPEDLPPKFKSWVIDYVQQNATAISASSITGSDRASISARLTRTADQAGWTGGVRDNIVFTVAEWDPASLWDNSTKLSASQPGKYLVFGAAEFTGATGQLEIWKNNTTRESVQPTASFSQLLTVLNLAKGDFCQLKQVPNSSSTVVHFEANFTPVFSITRVSA